MSPLNVCELIGLLSESLGGKSILILCKSLLFGPPKASVTSDISPDFASREGPVTRDNANWSKWDSTLLAARLQLNLLETFIDLPSPPDATQAYEQL